MTIKTIVRYSRQHPRGSAAVLFALMIPMFIGFLALSIDTAVLAVARDEMSTAADAAALAGAQQLADDRRLTQGLTDLTTEITNANTKAQAFGQANLVLHTAP